MIILRLKQGPTACRSALFLSRRQDAEESANDTWWHGTPCRPIARACCVPWDDDQACWRLIYESGRPVSLTLVNGDITK